MQRTGIFHRAALSQRLADHLCSEDGASGVFITGPRRTGKSTFLREDLMPLLSKQYATHVVYVDLWEDRSANPGDVLVTAIGDALRQFENLIIRVAKEMGASRFKVGNLELEIDSIGLGKGETLTKALTALAVAAQKPVTLIIDEAQHSQVSEEGRQALYAIKAARDAMNASTGPGFRLLATGSNADKLATLVGDKDQAFYQAPLIPLPPLGDDYLAWFRQRLRIEPKPSLQAMSQAFDMCNHRPEPLKAIFRALALNLDLRPDTIDVVFAETAKHSLAKEKEYFFQHINGLDPLDAAVIKVMARDGKRFAPYTKQSFVDYRTFACAITGQMPSEMNQSAVQQALERLRAEKFIWRVGRGAYFIEDPQHTQWINEDSERYAEQISLIQQDLLG